MPRRTPPTVAEAKQLVAYHERILATTRSGDRRLRSEQALRQLRALLAEEEPELPFPKEVP
jgi:hypothetical protein